MPKSRVLVVGGGFGGAYTARHLLKRQGDVSVLVVAPNNYFVFQPLLPEVVGGAINPLDTVTPLRMMLPGAEIRTAFVRGVDFARNEVEVVGGNAGKLDRIGYDQLVLAFGQTADLSRFPGLAEHGFTVKEAADSYALRNHVIGCLERAGSTADPEHRRRLLTFVIVGGGFSGIEVLGELHELVHRALRFYPHLGRSEPSFVVVEYQNAILPEVPPDLAAYAHRTLERRGVRFILGQGVKAAAATSLELDDGTVIETTTIVATIGSGPNPLARAMGLELVRGRIRVGGDMRLPGHDNVWALGDAAFVPLEDGKPAPPTAQAATQQAEALADNIRAALAGRPTRSFAYRPKGALASLGGRRAVAQVYGLKLSGMPAWVLWRLVYVSMLPAWSTRIRVGLEQLLDLFLPRSIVRTQAGGTAPSRYVRHREGDLVMSPGQLGDGVHLVIDGSYEQVGGGRVFLPGDTFGADEIAAGVAHERAIRAREPSRCFILSREEYERIHGAMSQARARRQLEDGGPGRALSAGE